MPLPGTVSNRYARGPSSSPRNDKLSDEVLFINSLSDDDETLDDVLDGPRGVGDYDQLFYIFPCDDE